MKKNYGIDLYKKFSSATEQPKEDLSKNMGLLQRKRVKTNRNEDDVMGRLQGYFNKINSMRKEIV